MKQISDLIIDAVLDELSDAFADAPDVEVVGRIKGGLLQENPVKLKTSIRVHVNDPDDPDGWQDADFAIRDKALDRSMFVAEAYEVGSAGGLWWRRFTAELEYYGIKDKVDREEARRIANLQKGKIERVLITSTTVPGLTDDLGEIALKIQPVSSSLSEGGGPKKQFIWRGKTKFQVLTQRSF